MTKKKTEKVETEVELEKQGLGCVSDCALAGIIQEAVNEENFNNNDVAQAAFRELQRRSNY